MKRRSFFKNSVFASLVLGIPVLLGMNIKKPKIEGKFVHMVFFYLKEATSVEEFIAITSNFITSIDLVKSYHLGIPAGTPRDVVDNSYSVCLVATFDSKEDQNDYQVHPIHLKFVEDHKDKWDKVVIYDSWAG
jgi:hypothetical protein